MLPPWISLDAEFTGIAAHVMVISQADLDGAMRNDFGFVAGFPARARPGDDPPVLDVCCRCIYFQVSSKVFVILVLLHKHLDDILVCMVSLVVSCALKPAGREAIPLRCTKSALPTLPFSWLFSSGLLRPTGPCGCWA